MCKIARLVNTITIGYVVPGTKPPRHTLVELFFEMPIDLLLIIVIGENDSMCIVANIDLQNQIVWWQIREIKLAANIRIWAESV